ncbi:MAG: hypothetical protein QNJ07_08250 [Woeseiaceae bacterium]|nr:hypothetical protein [Woeseiaceae bacterium]
MTKFSRFGLAAVTAVLVLSLSACGKDKEEAAKAVEAGILQFIPADTPYVFVTLESAPDELADKIEPHVDTMLDAYKIIIRDALNSASAEIEEGSEEMAVFEKAQPAIEEFMTILSVDGMKSIGIDRESRFAIYGNGLLPVMRISLTDPKLLDAAIARIEEKAGESMAVGEIDGNSYRYFEEEDVKLVVGTFGNYMVVTGMPSSFGDDQLAQLVGIKLPDRNIGDSGELAKIAKEFGYTNHMLGLVSSERIAATFLDAPTGLNAALLAGKFDPSTLSDVCREEIREMAGLVPRLVTGYTSLSADRMDASMIMELRSDIASGLAKLPTAVPGLGVDQGGLFTFGMSLNVKEMRDFYAARLDAIEADPWECEFFADLQAGAVAGRAALNQPVPPMVYDIRGFVAVVNDITGMDIANQQPPENIDAGLVLAVENAPALLQLGAMFSPEIASLGLQPDGKAVEFAPQQLGGVVENSFVALEDNALALSVGEGAEREVTDLLGASSADPAPFMSMAIDAERYYGFIGDAMMLDEGDDELSPEGRAAMRDMLTAFGELYDRLLMDVHFTSRGIEFDTTVTLGD